MKAYFNNKHLQFLAILLFILVLGIGCASTKYIEDYQSIVKKVKIDSVDKKYEEQAYNYVQKDIRPPGGIGLNVRIYNIFNTKNGKYKTSNIRPLGEKPPILDSTLVEISRNQIEKYLKSKGYFMAKVESKIEVKEKKAKLLFTAHPGPAFTINKVIYDISDTTVKQIYLSNKKTFTRLHENAQYDEDSLAYEREQIYKLLRQNGYYDFVRPYVRYEPDSNQNNSKVKVKLVIDNPIDGKSRHRVYTIGETKMVIAAEAINSIDTTTFNKKAFNGLRYTDYTKRFRRNPIARYNFIKQGELYDISKEQLTYDRLYQLNVFKNVKIDYSKATDSSNKIDPIILLIPQKRMSNRIDGEVPFNSGTIGFTISNTYTNNNFFRGAERFQFQVRGGLQSRVGTTNSIFNDIYQKDFSVSASLAVPRLMVPFSIPLMGKNGMPFTTFSTSYLYALQKDITVRRIFINSITYDWVETKSKLHSLTPLNFEYRFGEVLIDSNNVSNPINQIQSNLYNIILLARKDLTLGVKYAYSLNADKLLQNRSFIYFRGNVDVAGNLLQGATKLFGAGNAGNFLGLPFNQYVRPEVDFRWYKALTATNQFVARLNAGIGYAYGNSSKIPFEKLFFGGGSNGVRAWQARTLGPGNYNREVIKSEEGRTAFFGIDQLGEMKIETNFEYRFMLINKLFGGKLLGASFIDMGNVWNLNGDVASGKFKADQLLNQIAIGTGVGFRFDVQFFVFRFDLGLKLKDPQFAPGNQWVIGKFGSQSFKDDYFLRHSPDRYRFMQYNFGIGMPF